MLFQATQYDNPDRYALGTLRVLSRGLRLTRRAYTVAVPEDVRPGQVLLTLHTLRPTATNVNYLYFIKYTIHTLLFTFSNNMAAM